MIPDLKPYPAMKDSGVPWLGEVPSHWTHLPGRACYREKRVQNKGLTETTVLSLSYGHIVVKPPEKLHGLVPASFETYQIVEPGDIIVRPTDLQNDWNSLRFGLSRDRGIITSAYMCLCAEEVLTRPYGHFLFHTYDLKKVFYGLGSGLRQNLDWRDFKYLPCIVPPLPEQAAIVRYPRPRRPAHPALHPRQTEAGQAAGGAEAGPHLPDRHGPDRRAHRPALPGLQALRRRVAGGRAGALGGAAGGRLFAA